MTPKDKAKSHFHELGAVKSALLLTDKKIPTKTRKWLAYMVQQSREFLFEEFEFEFDAGEEAR